MKGRQIGPYEILEVLGEGGMGAVYLARQHAPIRRRVALKLMRESLRGSDMRARFEVERAALSLMDHPHVARVLDAGLTETGEPYVVMEHVSGLPIDRYCAANQLTVRERVALFVDVCNAIQHAHHKGVIHRDLKPANILVTTVDDRPVPKVIDFGLAKSLRGDLGAGRTRWGQVLGTPEYMSPEQADPRGVPVDARTDVYSLGAVLYELLTGDCPLGRRTLSEARFEEVLRRLLQDEPPTPSRRLESLRTQAPETFAQDDPRVARHLRGDLDWILLRALDRDPERRYASPHELGADLARYLRGEPVEAGPLGRLYRMRRFVGRHRVAVLAAGAILVTLVGALLVGFRLYFRSEEARRRVESFVGMGIVRAADELWPLGPERVEDMDRWLLEARSYVAGREAQRRRLLALQAQGLRDQAGTLTFATTLARREYEMQVDLLAAMDALADPKDGLIARVERRRRQARELEEPPEDVRRAWAAARERIARAAGVDLPVQRGLVPLGPDPRSGLAEFAYALSGEVPVREARTGRLVLTEDFALVFVLVPAGSFWMGAQCEDPEGRNYHRRAIWEESPVRRVTITRPFLLSKYECTAAQWFALTEGGRPNFYVPSNIRDGKAITRSHPVEGVGLATVRTWAGRHGLGVPTEAQWEYACTRGIPDALRAAWGHGERREALIACVNMADQAWLRHGKSPGDVEPHEDGWAVHAPVGTFAADILGLHDMLGNVAEWVEDVIQDGPDSRYGAEPVADPVGKVVRRGVAVVRGGSFANPAWAIRPSIRSWKPLIEPYHDVGWRPTWILRP